MVVQVTLKSRSVSFRNVVNLYAICVYIFIIAGADTRGGGPGGQDPPFWGPPNFIKREKTSRVCARMARVLVLNSYADPPLSEILYPPLHCMHHVNVSA